ncbi:MAG: sulfite exporter TauE/SafE family protein [Ignavibacteriales bacterium]|nr:sulfite exporter TauE/SafE family protein [Ignavibacteriales bacterium]
MIAIISGFAAGFLHVLSGPDHLAAIAPLAAEKRKSTWNIGLRWGLGHTSGVFIIGVLLIIFRDLIPFYIFSSFSEKLVGIILIGIGLWGLQKVFTNKIHVHEHEHNGITHKHFHSHTHTANNDKPSTHFHTHTALAVGLLHGLAGSSHIFGVLPALAFSNKVQSIEYLISFGMGTILAMMAFSQLIGISSNYFVNKQINFYKGLMFGFSIVAIGVGIVWIFI